MDRRGPLIGFSALAVAVLVAGVIVTGGPAQGRAEKRDSVRWRDVSEIATHIGCRSSDAGRLVTDLAATPTCPFPPRVNDPFTDTPYTVTALSDDSVSICATFETESQYRRVDGQGCYVDRVSWRAAD
ncbi:hypothetical protein [Paracoccus sp. (in: a-proteobacteria)]|uniref:hypothetical protein n=1 Tax=Paracoccus sp. TaxID=267 RepID=UPI0026E077EF|nr:hypothetical protein [Paracoccus sp. (in: a-proteobacteria)]MDO5648140.1 hypothetical protein [Paracoccus sp. (in: a-proteobacteria)]